MMSKKEQILFNLLQSKGFDVKSVCFYPTFGYLPDAGWTAIILIKEDDLICEQEYHLGNDFAEAKGQIENNEIKILD